LLQEKEAAVVMGGHEALAAQHSVHSSAALDATRRHTASQQIHSADSFRAAVDSTIPGRVTVSDRNIRGQVLPDTTTEEVAAMRKKDNVDIVETLQRKLSAQHELMNGAQKRSLYRLHAPAKASAISGNDMSTPYTYENSTTQLRRSISASSYNMRAPAPTVYSGVSDKSDSGYSTSSSDFAGGSSGMGALNTQIQSLSSRIRSRLQKPPPV
jgi:hypothetical protein